METWRKGIPLITGYSFKREDYTSLVKSSNKAHRTNNALYLSWDHAFNDRFSTTVGLRGEMIDDPFDDQRIINPQFQTLYKINDFGKNLRAAMFRNIQTFSFANIDRFSSASLVTRMTTDVTNIQNAYMMMLRMAMRAPASIICAMAMSFFISPRLATIYLIAVIVLGALLLFISKAAMKYFDRAFKRYDDLNESVQENVSAIRVVKAYVREDYEKKRFSKAAQNIYDVFVKAESLSGIQLSAHAVYSVCLHPVNKLARSSYGGKQHSHYR